MIIDQIKPNQVNEVSTLIQRNLLEINSKDYPPEVIAYLVDCFSPEKILENTKTQKIYVAIDKDKLIGTGGLANFGSPERPSYYGVAIFVAPEYHRQGIGKQLMNAVEAKAIELGANKITVRAAIGARKFYEKLGYQYLDGKEVLNERGNYIMLKEFQNQK
jgi:GNAT superfamily N-acetyltransferase